MLFALPVALMQGTLAQSAPVLPVALPGVSEPVYVGVTEGNPGIAHVRAYPKTWMGQAEVFSMLSPYGAKLDGATCQKIQEQVQLAASNTIPPLMKERLKELIRQSGSVSLRVEGIPFLPTQKFKRAIMDAYAAHSAALNSVEISNPLSLQSFRVELKWEKDAWSKVLGEEEKLLKQVEGLFSATTLLSGESSGELSALDLACDLASGRARLLLALQGQESGTQAERDLIPMQHAHELVEKIQLLDSKFFKGGSPLDLKRNFVLGGLFLQSTLEQMQLSQIPNGDKIAIHERLFSADQGLPLKQDAFQLAQTLRVPTGEFKRFTGVSTFSIKEQP